MERALLRDLVCPYCNGSFTVANGVETDADRLRYALVECRCFKFPIVDGVLLLSLTKAYGGAEEELQPYVPLQIAAIEFLGRGDARGLRAWIRRHMPISADFLEGTPGTYLHFRSKMVHQLEGAISAYLIAQGRYESIGVHSRVRLKELMRKVYRFCCFRLRPSSYEMKTLLDYYANRFFSLRANSLAMQLQSLPLEGRLLSLCCGHGVFENLIAACSPSSSIVSIDGQFLNLLATRHYANPTGTYICHDLQLPLPFPDRYFDGVFSSTCLPEIPTQRSFIKESIRVTRDTGWSLFDSIWTCEMGPRIDRLRHYRFAQNFFSRFSDYIQLFSESVTSGREIALGIPSSPDAYTKSPDWVLGKSRITEVLQGSSDTMISVLIISSDRLPLAQSTEIPRWLSPEKLYVSPAFSVKPTPRGELSLKLRPWVAHPPVNQAPTSFKGYPATEILRLSELEDPESLLQAFCRGLLVLLPRAFGDEPRCLSDFL